MRAAVVLKPARRLAILFMLGLSGCAAPQTGALLQNPTGLSSRAEVAGVPFFPQKEKYCGPAALGMVLAWSGLPVTQQEVAKSIYTPGREGTLRADVLAGARRYGRLAVQVDELSELLAEVKAGHPVIVFQNLALDWFPKWHYAVVVGYDLTARQLVLRSGLEERLVIKMDAFERTWERGNFWALVVLPPDRLPATADRFALLKAAAGLERARRLDAAATAYATIGARWPELWVAHMGLGNARYAQGRFEAAEKAYRAAIVAAPGVATPWNNLAYALAKQGRRSEAIAAARKAVSLAGDKHLGSFRNTLNDVKGMRS